MPLLEHATAVLDAHTLMRVFSVWAVWCRGVRILRAARVRSLLSRHWDKWEIRTRRMKAVRKLAIVNTRRTGKALFGRCVMSASVVFRAKYGHPVLAHLC